ncbi:hypothetical protein ABPG73_022913 [Tetrahymena malaccensis]
MNQKFTIIAIIYITTLSVNAQPGDPVPCGTPGAGTSTDCQGCYVADASYTCQPITGSNVACGTSGATTSTDCSGELQVYVNLSIQLYYKNNFQEEEEQSKKQQKLRNTLRSCSVYLREILLALSENQARLHIITYLYHLWVDQN